MLFFYQFIVSILLLFSPIIILYRILKKKEDKKRFLEKFFFSIKNKKRENIIWFHAASVGETMSIIPLIQFYEKNKKIDKILVTSITVSSSKLFKKYKFRKTIHKFFPIDHIFFVKNFLNYWKPKLAIFIESEIWPCMFNEIKKKNIPLVLLNARITKKTFDRWIYLKNFSKTIFKYIDIAFPQNSETENYLRKLKVKKVKPIGNIKFLNQTYDKQNKLDNYLLREFKKKKIWVASSTHHNEEIICAKSHIQLKNKIKNLITIIIPRHVERVEEISSNLKRLNLKIAIHSEKKKNLNDLDIYIVDTIGETEKFYKISNTVFMGKSLQNFKKGGQNPIEPARYGAKILHGPNVGNFKEVYKLLKSLKISKEIKNQNELNKCINFKKNTNFNNKINKIGLMTFRKSKKELNKLIYNEFKKT